MGDETRYAIGDLSDLAGVSRRTVRYYVQEDLLPAPYGVGRGNHYGREHLDEILRVKALQEAGRTLDEIRTLLHQGRHRRTAQMPEAAEPLPRTLWRRLTLASGVELHISDELRLPSQRKLQELASWCRTHLARADEREDTDD
jgi:DNA-binding transcriptional MerR regulator